MSRDTLPSVEAFTATNLSKLSSTRTRIASERESRPALRCAMPEDRSWYVAFGCTTDRNVFGVNDLDDMRIADSAISRIRKHDARGLGTRLTGVRIHIAQTEEVVT